MIHISSREIDNTLIPLCERLNKSGYTTMSSCSDLKKDHPGHPPVGTEGYMALAFLPKQLNNIKKAKEQLEPEINIYIKGSYLGAFLNRDMELSEERKEYLWNKLTDILTYD